MTYGNLGSKTVLLAVAFAVACGSGGLDSTDAGGTGNGTGGTTSSGGTSATGGAFLTGGSSGSGGTSSSSTQIASGTVNANVMVGAATSSCDQSLLLRNPAQSLSGYLQMAPSAYRGDSRAGDPSYAYLDAGKDAVIVPGPAVSYGASSVSTTGAQITTCVNAETACLGQDGYRVDVNSELAYVVRIDDWEDEIALGEVDLCMKGGTLTTQFVFAGIGGYLGGGVAQVSIMADLKGVVGSPTASVTIEAR
jgi:hypothetical protein